MLLFFLFTLLLIFLTLAPRYAYPDENKVKSLNDLVGRTGIRKIKGCRDPLESRPSLTLTPVSIVSAKKHHRSSSKKICGRFFTYPPVQQTIVALNELQGKKKPKMLIVKMIADIVPHGILLLTYGFAHVSIMLYYSF